MTARAESHHESTWLEAKTQILQALFLRASALSFCFFRSVLSVFIRGENQVLGKASNCRNRAVSDKTSDYRRFPSGIPPLKNLVRRAP